MVEIQLGNIDHESRHNSYRAADDENTTTPNEDTPLLHRFPVSGAAGTVSRITGVVVGLLVLTLASGVVIGVYLLILQSRAENIVPPVDIPLQLVSRTQWDASASAVPPLATSGSSTRAARAVATQTGTRLCHSLHDCADLLMALQAQQPGQCLPYNFLVSSSGHAFEALGWRRGSPWLGDAHSDALLLAFIGNFSETPPSSEQLAAAKSLFAVSVSLHHLDPSFGLYGARRQPLHTHLVRSLQALSQWRNQFDLQL